MLKEIIQKLLKPLQFMMQRALGLPAVFNNIDSELYKLKEADDAIFYYLNNYLLKADNLPPTSDPDLRIMQLCDVQLLRIVDKILTKHNLDYWLDYGTLLGAVRHKGFIPWDDDMDISVSEDDFDEVMRVLKDELSSIDGFEVEEKEVLGRIGVGYRHYETGVWLDIFSLNDLSYTGDRQTFFYQVKTKRAKYRTYYLNNVNKVVREEIKRIKRKHLPKESNCEKKLYFVAPERNIDNNLNFDYSDIYPIKELSFEGYLFKVPNNYNEVLIQNFSKSYMTLARGGVLHHGNGNAPLSQWAKNNGINMEKILSLLRSVNEKF